MADSGDVAQAAAFLDRDGVLNAALGRAGRPHPPDHVDDLVLLPGVIDACRELKSAGLRLIVVSNQPDIARGTTTSGVVAAINEELARLLPLDEIVVCPHDDGDGCSCRKPKPGMIFSAAERWGVDLRLSSLVGDRWRDVHAGRAAGVATIFLDRGYQEERPADADLVANELIDAVPFIVQRASGRST